MACLLNKALHMTTAAALGSSGVISLTLGSRTEEDGCEMESSFCAAVMIALKPEGIRPPRPFTRSRPPSSGSVNSASDRRLLDHVLRDLPDAEAPPSPLRRDECADQLIADLRVQFVDVVVAQLRQHRVGALQGVRLVDLDVHFIARGVRLHQHARRAVRRQDQNRELELAQLYPSGNDADITVYALLGSARLCGRAVRNRPLYA